MLQEALQPFSQQLTDDVALQFLHQLKIDLIP